MPPTKIPLKERFWTRVEKRGEGDCWLWTGFTDKFGYGRVSVGRGCPRFAHRVAWEITNGRPPNGHVCHSCDNPPCVNPAHLWVGTHQDNMRDMVAKGRNRFGAKWTEARQSKFRS